MTYLLDTNVVAELTTRPKPAPAVIEWARSVPATEHFLSVITIAEIEAGVEAAPDPLRRAALELVLDGIRAEYQGRIAVIDERGATAYLAVHRQLKKVGASIDPPDALIAATAVANGWTLVSRTVKHLARTGATVLNPWDY
ncbi:type II toxin-antitoxin system VapC family toxin [Kitasatospora sp. NPDC058190]|uniref:type II toxin-antitoxin system VapC family toxin n=1 Tax=Kitasatospora sp. NPDC058190 TaxID=3346371 RepID=UPI0036D76979